MSTQTTEQSLALSRELAYELVKKSFGDPAFIEKYKKDYRQNPRAMTEEAGITDPDEAEQVTQMVDLIVSAEEQASATQKLLLKQLETTMQTADQFKLGLQTTVKQIDEGFNATMRMYTVAFYLGVGLVVASAIFAVVTDGSLFALALGGLGTADIITYFLTKPPQDLQRSRADLTQLQAAFFNWFTDAYNWNSYLSAKGPSVQLAELKEVSATLFANTDRTMGLIEKYCELVASSKRPQEEGR